MSKATNETKAIRKHWNSMRKQLDAMASEYIGSEHDNSEHDEFVWMAYKMFGYKFMFSTARKSATVRVWPEYVGAFLGYEPVADFIRDTDCKVEVEIDMIRFVF